VSRFRIHVTLDKPPSRPIWGAVYIEVGEAAFPDRGWTDLACAFLAALGLAIRDLRSGQTLRVSFPDGPYSLTMRRTDGGVRLVGWNDYVDGSQIAFEETVGLAEMISGVLEAIVTAISQAEGMGHPHDDFHLLRGLAGQLRAELAV
jgi:hypothetical protein